MAVAVIFENVTEDAYGMHDIPYASISRATFIASESEYPGFR